MNMETVFLAGLLIGIGFRDLWRKAWQRGTARTRCARRGRGAALDPYTVERMLLQWAKNAEKRSDVAEAAALPEQHKRE